VWLRYLYADSPQNVTVHPAVSSVVIMWQPPGATLPGYYNITLIYTNNSDYSSQTHTSVIRVSGTTTELKHDRIVQGVRLCVSAIYGLQMSAFCHNFQTLDYVGSTLAVAVGVLSFIVVLL
jgi:hypothetical protein